MLDLIITIINLTNHVISYTYSGRIFIEVRIFNLLVTQQNLSAVVNSFLKDR
jgi:hypothetical protein